MTISTAHLRELARKASRGSDWYDFDMLTDDDLYLSSAPAHFIAACTPESIAALCDRADEAERLRIHLTDLEMQVRAHLDTMSDEATMDSHKLGSAAAAARAALSKGGE